MRLHDGLLPRRVLTTPRDLVRGDVQLGAAQRTAPHRVGAKGVEGDFQTALTCTQLRVLANDMAAVIQCDAVPDTHHLAF